jgi:hypothetical protein
MDEEGYRYPFKRIVPLLEARVVILLAGRVHLGRYGRQLPSLPLARPTKLSYMDGNVE